MSSERIQHTFNLRTLNRITIGREAHIVSTLRGQGIPVRRFENHTIEVERGRIRLNRNDYEETLIVTWWSE